MGGPEKRALRREVRGGPDLCGAAASGPDAQGHRHPLRHAPARGRGDRRRERRYRGRGRRSPPARRPEDQGGETRLAEIRERFGAEVADIVAGNSDTYQEPKPPWRGRKEMYVAHVARAPHSVRLVSAADKLHNARSVLADLRCLGEDLWPRFNGGRKGTLWYYRALVEAFRSAGSNPVVEELDRVVGELERLARKRD